MIIQMMTLTSKWIKFFKEKIMKKNQKMIRKL